jgi:hypothetical protein
MGIGPFLNKKSFTSQQLEPTAESYMGGDIPVSVAPFKNYGVSGTDTDALTQGALLDLVNKPKMSSIITQAQDIADKTLGDYTPSEPDWGVMSLLYFSKMAEEASKPGATALGAAGSAFTTPAAYLMQKQKDEADRKEARETKKASIVTSLIPSLYTASKTKAEEPKPYLLKSTGKPVFMTNTEFAALSQADRQLYEPYKEPKVGKPSAVNMGPVLDATGKQKTNAEGEQLFKFNVYKADGSIETTYEAPRGGGQTINIGKDEQKSEFGKGTAKMSVEEYAKFRNASIGAFQKRRNVEDLLTMLANPELATGWKEEKFMLPLRQIGAALGFNVDTTKIANQQAFRAKTFEIVLDNVSKMKGALSDKELEFLKNMNASLGMQKNANKLLLLSTHLALKKAERFNQFAIDWQNANTKDDKGVVQGLTTTMEFQQMIADFKSDEFNQLNPRDYITRLSDAEESRLVVAMGGQVYKKGDNIPQGRKIGDYKEGTLTLTQENEIAQKLENKFALSLMNRVFGNVFRPGESAYGTKKDK